jgi:hypothetical protein
MLSERLDTGPAAISSDATASLWHLLWGGNTTTAYVCHHSSTGTQGRQVLQDILHDHGDGSQGDPYHSYPPTCPTPATL